jgi:integrase
VGLVVMLSEHVRAVGVHPDGWLFIGKDGPPHHDQIYYASGLIAAGCDVVTVQRALGHASASTTLDTYAHLWPNAEDHTCKAASGLMKAALTNLADAVRTEAE